METKALCLSMACSFAILAAAKFAVQSGVKLSQASLTSTGLMSPARPDRHRRNWPEIRHRLCGAGQAQPCNTCTQ